MACVQQSDGSWTPESMSSGPDPFALVGLAFLAMIVLGVAGVLWRVHAARLRELDRLRDEGLVTATEHASRRAAIIAEV